MSANAATATAQPPAAAAQPGGRDVWGILKMVALYWGVSQLITKFVLNPYLNPSQSAEVANSVLSDGSAPAGVPVVTTTRVKDPAEPLWPLGTQLAVDIYVSNSPNPADVVAIKGHDAVLAHLSWDNIKWGNWSLSEAWTGHIPIPKSVQNNETMLFAHVFLAADGADHNPYKSGFNGKKVHHFTRQLTRFRPRKRVVRQKNLLASDDETEKDDAAKEEEETEDIKNAPWVPYWYQNLTLALISDSSKIPLTQLPPPLIEHVHFVPGEMHESGQPHYYPIVFANTFWQLSSNWKPYSELNSSLPLRIDFHALSYMKFQMYATMAHGFEQAAAQQGAAAGSEIDEVKRMFLETNVYLLIVTAIVSALHMLFEFLAFAADVSHWRQKKEFTGLSVRTIVTNVFVQVVILLYLLDNNEDTSWMILFGQGSGALIEAWKITKVLDFKLGPAPPGSVLPYTVIITDKHVLSDDEKKTQEYDQLAYRYVSYVAIPLLFGYTVYSLVYESHKGWYSFTIRTLTSFVYMFGFAQLVPQLIINYKLKSVAHLPGKAFMYKFFSTIVDDFFAFCIKMPFLHRLACFRDDAVFLVYLYQRWIYRVDPKRVNEYGQVLEGEEKVEATKQGQKTESKKDK